MLVIVLLLEFCYVYISDTLNSSIYSFIFSIVLVLVLQKISILLTAIVEFLVKWL